MKEGLKVENLPSIKKISLFEKIKNNIKHFFGMNQEKTEQQETQQINEVVSKDNFKEKIKFEEDLEKKKLLEIQRRLEEGGMTLEVASELTRDLTSEEKSDLLELYKTQINKLEESLKNYKKRILTITKKV